MNDFRDELTALQEDVMDPGITARERVAARLTHSIAALASAVAPSPKPSFAWAAPLRLATAFVVGGVTGAGLYGTLRPPAIERVFVERAGVAPSVALPRAQRELETLPSPPSPTPTASAKPAIPGPALSAASDRSSSIAEQQALLDEARADFTHGDYAQTLATLAKHFQRFPKSVLAEEREALEIKALAAGGELPRAQRLATRFQAQYPQSLLLPSLRNSVGEIP